MPGKTDAAARLCHCGHATIASVDRPLPGVHYCILGMCPPAASPA